jgi:hypothetical protein
MSRMDKSSKGINKYYYSKSIVYPPPRQQRKLKKLKIHYSPDLKSHIDLLNPPSGVAMGGPDPPLFFRTNFSKTTKTEEKMFGGRGLHKVLIVATCMHTC